MNELFIAVFIPITTGIIQALKIATGGKGKNFLPLISIVLGVVIVLGLAPLSMEFPERILSGIIVGLSAVGLFEAGTKTLDNKG